MTAVKRGRKPKYIHTIVLEGISARNVYKKYRNIKLDNGTGIPIMEYAKTSDNNTNLTELTVKRKNNVFLELKDAKIVTMIDYVNYGCLPDRTDIRCYNCHHTFNTSPIGVPIKYYAKRPDKVQPDDTKIVSLNDYFETFGIFCSFPCCMAFITSNRHLSMFRNSKSLLYSLYYKLYSTELDVKKAPSWECLKVYGGHLSIEEYRKSFCSCNYVITENIKRPYMVSVGKYIEERRCGFL